MLTAKPTVRQLLGFLIVITFITLAILPVLAAEERTDVQMDEHSNDFQMAQEQYLHFSHEGYDERHHCPSPVPQSYAAIENLIIDSSLMNATPHWLLLAAGKTEQKSLLDFVKNASVSRQKKTQLTFFLMTTWMKYPVKYIKTEDGAKLVPGKTPYRFALNPRENATFQEIEGYIADGMNQTSTANAANQGSIIMPQWAPADHNSFTTIACEKENIPTTPINLIRLAGTGAEVPDDWYNYPGGVQVHSLEHGYVPLGIPGMGVGFAPAKCGGFATLAKNKFILHDYSTSFTNLGYATHFMEDLGEPYHTPQVQIIPLQYIDDPTYYKQANLYGVLINYQALHNAYEGFFNRYWSTTLPQGETFGSVASSVADYQTISDPKSAAESLASQSSSINPSLVYSCYWYWVSTGTYDFQKSDTIVDKTKERVIQTQRYTRGLVRYVTGGQPPVFSTDWVWSRDGWGDWQHTFSYSGTEVGPNTEYGPVMVDDYGEHGTNTNLLAGSTQSSVWRTFTDTSGGSGWNTITFVGAIAPSDVPDGRWMTIDVNGQQVFGATEVQTPPGSTGQPFTIKASFTPSSPALVKISQGQNPAWGPWFRMKFYSVKLSNEKTLTAMAKSDETPFVIPDGSGLATNVTSSGNPVTP